MLTECVHFMRRRLFLAGPDECGKSEMIQQALGNLMGQAGGFITVRERDEQGNIVGYDMVAADGSGQSGRFLENVNGKPVTHLEVFSHVGAKLLKHAQDKPFAVLDELGGAELLDDSFVQSLVQLIKTKTPCIGVVKGLGQPGKAVGVMGLNLRYELARKVMYDFMTRDSDTMVLETTGLNDTEVMEKVHQWVAEYAQIL